MPNDNAFGLPCNLELHFVAVQPDHTAALAHHRAAAHLSGNLPLALTQDVIDGSRNCGDAMRRLAFGRPRTEALGKLLSDKAG